MTDASAAAAAAAAASLSCTNNGSGNVGGPTHGMERAHRKLLPPSEVPCKFFLHGYCFRGDTCWFKHELAPSSGFVISVKSSAATAPHSSVGNSNGMKAPMTAAMRAKCLENGSDNDAIDITTLDPSTYTAPTDVQTCSICYDTPKNFGLLDKCSHVFCLECIRKWRSSSTTRSNADSEMSKISKTCPLCRTVSTFIIPSSIFPKARIEGEDEDHVNPLKQYIVDQYLSKLKTIPCKYFEDSLQNPRADLPETGGLKTNPKCRFGNSCHYAHIDPRTSQPYIFTDTELRRQRRRPPQSYAHNTLRHLSRSEIMRMRSYFAGNAGEGGSPINYELYGNDSLEDFLQFMREEGEVYLAMDSDDDDDDGSDGSDMVAIEEMGWEWEGMDAEEEDLTSF